MYFSPVLPFGRCLLSALEPGLITSYGRYHSLRRPADSSWNQKVFKVILIPKIKHILQLFLRAILPQYGPTSPNAGCFNNRQQAMCIAPTWSKCTDRMPILWALLSWASRQKALGGYSHCTGNNLCSFIVTILCNERYWHMDCSEYRCPMRDLLPQRLFPEPKVAGA